MENRKKFFAVFLAVILTSISLIVIFQLPASSLGTENLNPNWLSGWTYRKSHDIQGSIGAGTGYQIKLTVYYQQGNDGGSAVYLAQKCQRNFADVRFTTTDGMTLLPYWVETKVDGFYGVFWVKVTSNLDFNQTIYIYYGNATVQSASSIQQTFPFADDFSGVALNASNWRTFGNGQITVNNGECILESVSGDRGWIYMLGKTQFGTNYAVRFRSLVIEQGDLRWTHHGFATIYNDTDQSWGRIDEYPNYISASQEASYYAWALKVRAFSNTSRLDLSNYAPAVDVFYTYDLARNGTTNVIYACNDQQQGTISTNVPTVQMGAMFAADNYGSTLYSVTVLDWVVIHKYVANEPLQGVWSKPETQTSSISSSN